MESLATMIEKFERALKSKEKASFRMCKIYAKAVDTHKNAKGEFRKAFPHVNNRDWSLFEKVGKKQMIPELLFDFSQAGTRLKYMPLSTQKQLYGKSMELVTSTGDILKVGFHAMTNKQSRQLIAKDHVRTLEEQRAWIETMKAKKKAGSLYVVEDGLLKVKHPCSFNKDEVIAILAEM